MLSCIFLYSRIVKLLISFPIRPTKHPQPVVAPQINTLVQTHGSWQLAPWVWEMLYSKLRSVLLICTAVHIYTCMKIDTHIQMYYNVLLYFSFWLLIINWNVLPDCQNKALHKLTRNKEMANDFCCTIFSSSFSNTTLISHLGESCKIHVDKHIDSTASSYVGLHLVIFLLYFWN